ncbi:hypothetical protein BCB70_09075 [Cutibacterium modestum]|nr:hypothetical protein BCB70_09075 [Cutibacterium modestum]EFS73731.1 hypothetical protein HMPREF9621_01825 [Cutibacterium modestum HL037PA2]EFT14657.1 hypothetical protein HMPREF9622_02338 [Cutibacterium modestum HL037PA3]
MWFWALVTCYWALVWRTPVWDIDDLYFATRSGTLGGRIDWADFARLTRYDLIERNGRFSDMMVQLVMAMGGWIRVPLVLSSLSMSLALWLMLRSLIRDLRGVVSAGADLLAGVGAFFVPMMLIGLDPHMGGDTIMFVAANIGYMWGLALGIVSILLLWSQRGPNVKHGWVLWVAVVLSLVASIHHELNVPGIVGAIVAMALITPAGKWTARWAVALTVVAVGNTARMGMPGLWARRLRMGGPYPYPQSTGEIPKRVSFVIHSVSHSFAHYPVVFVGIMLSVIVMCLVAMKRGFHSRVVGILLALFCVASIGLVVTSLRIVMLLARRNMSGDIYLYLSSTGLLTWVFFSVVMVILVVLAAMFSRIPGCGMVGVSTGAAIGYYALPVIQGFPGGRMSFLGLVVFTVSALVWAWTAVVLTDGGTDGGDGVVPVSEFGARSEVVKPWPQLATVLAIITAVSCLGAGSRGAWGLLYGATVNGSVWRTVNAQADAARRGERNTVVVPKALPAPDWLPDYAGHRQSSEDRLHQYYDLPKNVTVVRR